MDEREDHVSTDENPSPIGRHEAFQQEDYSDAHYERADETTIPPRYYTPPSRTARETKKDLRNRPGNRSLLTMICCTLAAALLGGACGAAWTGQRLSARVSTLEAGLTEHQTALETLQNSQPSAPAEEPMRVQSEMSGMDPADIYAQAVKQVVGIRTEISVTNVFGITSSGAVNGSGFLISEDGYILTNYHVIEKAYSGNYDIEIITYDGTSYNAVIVGAEALNDIAVLKIDAEGLNTVRFGDSDSIRVGEAVYAIGNPLGELEFSMSTGHVSALDRVINTQETEAINMFQIDAAVNEGNSGGPVYNSDGEVIGIVTAKYSSSGVEGLGFAIPINDAKAISDDLITKGYVTGKAYMGITYDPEEQLDPRYAAVMGIPGGLTIHDVEPGSAAETAGLQTYDIITAIGDYTIESYSDLRQALRHFSAGESAVMTVYRPRENTLFQMTIVFDEARPDNQ